MTKDCCGITSSAESSFNYGSEPTQAKTQLGLLSPCLTWNKRGTNLMPSSVTNSASLLFTAILRSLLTKKMNQTSHCTFCVVQTLHNVGPIPNKSLNRRVQCHSLLCTIFVEIPPKHFGNAIK